MTNSINEYCHDAMLFCKQVYNRLNLHLIIQLFFLFGLVFLQRFSLSLFTGFLFKVLGFVLLNKLNYLM